MEWDVEFFGVCLIKGRKTGRMMLVSFRSTRLSENLSLSAKFAFY